MTISNGEALSCSKGSYLGRFALVEVPQAGRA